MFADPQAVTIAGTAYTLPRVGSQQPDRRGNFVSADGNIQLSVSQNSTSARFRREIRLTQKKVAADPISAINKEVSTSVMIVVDEPRWGFIDSEISALLAALTAHFAASTKLAEGKLLGGEL